VELSDDARNEAHAPTGRLSAVHAACWTARHGVGSHAVPPTMEDTSPTARGHHGRLAALHHFGTAASHCDIMRCSPSPTHP
jgi:hypothetical protein